MKGVQRVALLLGMAAFTAPASGAVEIDGPADKTTHEIRVVNNYQSPVLVYAQDANGRLHQLGRVTRGEFKVLELPNEIADLGLVQLKVFPTVPTQSLIDSADGIRTNNLWIQDGQSVNMYLESDLKQSMIQVEIG